MSEFFTVLHLSDLHLGYDWKDVGRADKGFGQNALRIIAGKGDKQQSHDPLLLTDLPNAIKSAAWQASNCSRYDFDCCVVTGDISTRADDDERHRFARNFLIGGDHKVDGATLWSGLNLQQDKLLCLPGNHDVIGEKQLTRFLGGFNDLPSAPSYTRIFDTPYGKKIIFYGIDSNPQEDSGLYSEGTKPWEAGGRIHRNVLAWLDNELSKVVENGTIRILLVHHHPCDLNRRKRIIPTFATKAYRRLTVLENGKELLEKCKDKVDVIMHGHEHCPVVFNDDNSGAFIVSAGTTSQWHAGRNSSNSFYTLRFSENSFQVSQFEWVKLSKDKRTLVKGHEARRVKWWDCDLVSKTCSPHTHERDLNYVDDVDEYYKLLKLMSSGPPGGFHL